MNLWSTAKSVAWGFVGLRSRQGLEQDAKQVQPIALILIGIACALVFIASLILLVNLVVKS